MEIIFGLSLDGPSYQSLLTTNSAVMGKVVCGPLGLLQILEKRTGLGGDWAPQPLRVEAYRQRMSAADDGQRFYTESLHADSHSVAETLLSWRDELYLAGWDFSVTTKLPRLRDLAAVERTPTSVPAIPFGFPERFHAVLQALPSRILLIKQITLAEPRSLLGSHWEKLLAALETCSVTVSEWTPPPHQATGDLRAAQEGLLGGRARTATGDGSLVLLTSESEVHVADVIGAWFGCQPSPHRLLLLPRNDRTLERIMARCGLPTLGVHSYSAQRPVLQVLPLLCELLWEPLNPYRLVEFLTLPDTPIPRHIARKLAETVASAPGIGGRTWVRALAELEKNIAAKDTTLKKWPERRKAVATWLEGERYPLSPGIPTIVLAKLARNIAQWAGGHPLRDDEDDSQLKALSAQASHLATILETQPEPHVTQPQLHRLLRMIQGEGKALGDVAEAGHQPWVYEPEAILAPVEDLVWTGFTSRYARGVTRPPWTQQETRYLQKLGVLLPDPKRELARLVEGYRRVVLMTTKRLILVTPQREAGEESGTHPLRDRLAALFGDSLKKLELRDTEWLCGNERICCLKPMNVDRRELPRPKRFWSVPISALPKRDIESYSSLMTMFQKPYHWVLTYPAKLKEGPIQAIGSSRTLMGNLAHRVFEELFTPGETCTKWTAKTVTTRINALVTELLPQEGAVFLLPGFGSQRREFERKTRASAIEMARQIRENNWKVVGTEHPTTGMLLDQDLTGSVDLLLTKDDGTYAVVDLKWTIAKYLRFNFTESRCYQLALYAHMLKKKCLPHVAYFSLTDAQLIAPDARAFTDARIAELPEGESLPTLLTGIQVTYQFRRQQLEEGTIEVPVTGTIPDPARILPAACLIDPEDTKNPEEYLALVGWAEDSHA